MSLSYKKLYQLFFDSFPKEASKFIALSGYVGFDPILDLKRLPFKSDIIYGMFKEIPRPLIHKKLLTLNDEKTKIYYPKFLCHSKCYIWFKDEKPIKGYIGSANFSLSGLKNDYKETLYEVENKELYAIKAYIELVLSESIICSDFGKDLKIEKIEKLAYCLLPLYDLKTGQTQNAAALNWGMSPAHVSIDDAYIPILHKHIREFPNLFPPKLPKIENKKRQNEVIEIIWDDGLSMIGLLEGSQSVDGIIYPKQISSFPKKNILGKYIRSRIGIASGKRIEREDLIKYGKDTIMISLLSEGVYFFDFKPD